MLVALLGVLKCVTPFQPHRADAGAARTSPGRSQSRLSNTVFKNAMETRTDLKSRDRPLPWPPDINYGKGKSQRAINLTGQMIVKHVIRHTSTVLAREIIQRDQPTSK